MRRLNITPRFEWERKVAEKGLTYYQDYWKESAYFEITLREVENFRAATREVQRMALEAAQFVIDNDRFGQLAIPPAAIPVIKAVWEEEPPAIYGRMDFTVDADGTPKLLEYNADTPTSLLEASVIQWHWFEERFGTGQADQFNKLHPLLVNHWMECAPYLLGDGVLHFVHGNERYTEDLMTTAYMRDTAEQAGITCRTQLVDQLEWNADTKTFRDLDNVPMSNFFKLYPWEWFMQEPIGEMIIETYETVRWIEPMWKMLLSNKGILAIMWELFPDSPYLLPTYFDEHGMEEFASKPLLGREGANVFLTTRDGMYTGRNQEYGKEGRVYQQYCALPVFDGFHAVVGSWLIDQEPAGVGFRESESPISNNDAFFVPHLVRG